MVGRKQIGWKKLVAAVALTASFLVGSIFIGGGTAQAALSYNWTNNTTVTVADWNHANRGDPVNFVFTCSTNSTTSTCAPSVPSNFMCPVRLVFTNSATSAALTYQQSTLSGAGTPICSGIDRTETVTVGTPTNAPSTLPGGSGGGAPGGAGGNASPEPELECGTAWTSITWYFCPFIQAINKGISTLDGWIVGWLTVDQDRIFETTTPSGKGYRAAWEAFRGFALAILIIGGLVMVIAQALGFAILDAYTIKKILPRLVIAIIGIALSWEIMKFFVGFTNDLGIGVRQIIYYPFKDFTAGNGVSLSNSATLLAALLALPAMFALGIGGLASFVLTAALGILIAFLVLIIRQMVIVVLVLFAPIAIACSILPNTQGVYKLWYESLMKAMMMFPIIVAFLAVGRVIAVTNMDPAGGPERQLIAFGAYFAPYFLIPLTFRFAGGAMRTLCGITNDKGRGGFDRLRKFRGGRIQERGHAMKGGTLYRPSAGRVARGFNSLTSTVASAPQAGMDPRKMRSRFKSAQAVQTFNAAMEIQSKNPDFAAGAQDDRILKAAQYGKNRTEIREQLMGQGIVNPTELDTAVGTVERMQHTGSPQAVKAAIALQRFATGTGYNDENGFNYNDAYASIMEASGGDRALAGRLLGASKGAAAQAGQLAWGGASYGKLNEGLDATWGKDGKEYKELDAVNTRKLALDAFQSNDANTILRAREPHVQAMTTAAVQRVAELSNGATSTEPGELGRLLAQIENFKDTATVYAGPGRQNIINNVIQNIEPAQQNMKAEFKKIDEMRDNADKAAKNAREAGDTTYVKPIIELPDDLLKYSNFRSGRGANLADVQLREEPKKDGA